MASHINYFVCKIKSDITPIEQTLEKTKSFQVNFMGVNLCRERGTKKYGRELKIRAVRAYAENLFSLMPVRIIMYEKFYYLL